MQNEILKTMAHMILRDIASDIQKARWFSLIVDETTDTSIKEQVSICLRYVNNQNMMSLKTSSASMKWQKQTQQFL